jgi:phosphoglycolate phosphatase
VIEAPRLVVFDLDGTLIDSRMDLIRSVNATLDHFGRQPLEDLTVASYIGDGATTLVRRALAHAHLVADEPDPHDDAFVDQATDWFISFYRLHKLDFTRAYFGVMEALESIQGAHPTLPMAILTNKPVVPSREICRELGLERFFFANYGGNSFGSKKPNPEGLLQLIAEASALQSALRILPAQTVMVGDSHVDVETARACGARAVGCRYGLSPESLAAARPDAIVDQPSEWSAVLGLG